MTDTYEQFMESVTPDAYWQTLVAVGWLRQVPAERQPALEASVRSAVAATPRSAWMALAVVQFDSECIYQTGPEGLSYHAQIASLARQTYGVFQPEQIHDEQIGDRIRITFTLQGREYAYEAPAQTDYFDERVIGTINQALRDSGTLLQLIALPAIDQVIRLVVQPEDVYQRAVEAQLIPPRDYYARPQQVRAKLFGG